VTFATNVYSPTAAGYYRDDDDPGRFMGEEVSFSRITYFSPSVAMQVTDTLSLGASLIFSYQGIGIGLDLRVPNVGLVFAEGLAKAICEQDVPAINFCGGHVGPYTEVSSLSLDAEKLLSTTFNIGLLWQPTLWLSVDMVYQSGTTDTLEGAYKIEYDEWVGFWRQLREDNAGSQLTGLVDALGYPLPYGENI
jgi:long-subunit fatty acid transport protein